MRIAVATTSYPSEAGDPSGHFVRAHARALARDGADVVVFAPGASAAPAARELDEERVGDGSVRVVRLGGETLFAWPGAAARARQRPGRLAVVPLIAARAIRAIRRERSFELAIAQWIPCAHLFAALDLPLHVVAHGADVRLLLALPAPVRAAWVGALLDRVTRLQVVATALREQLCAALPTLLARRLTQRSFVEAAPFELPDRTSLPDPRAALGLRDDDRYVAWLGRLVADKRPELAVEAAHLAGRTLVLVGDGPRYAGLAASPRAGVVLTGRLPRDRALGVMSQASAVLHTSAIEGASTVIREARALGIPVVACASGDVRSWASRDPGISVVDADAASIAVALRSAVSSPRSCAHHGAAS